MLYVCCIISVFYDTHVVYMVHVQTDVVYMFVCTRSVSKHTCVWGDANHVVGWHAIQNRGDANCVFGRSAVQNQGDVNHVSGRYVVLNRGDSNHMFG